MSKLDEILIDYGSDATMAVLKIKDGSSLMQAVAKDDPTGHQRAKQEIKLTIMDIAAATIKNDYDYDRFCQKVEEL